MKQAEGSNAAVGWVAALAAMLLGYLSWTLPDSWHAAMGGAMDYALIVALVALAGVGGWYAWRTRSIGLAVASVIGLLSPLVVIVAAMLIVGL